MGQKINPICFRIGVNKNWDSKWYAKKSNYVKFLHEDIKIRSYIMHNNKNAAISKIIVERPAKKAIVTIQTARPGILIGKKGNDIEKIKGKLKEIINSEISLNIVEIKKPETNAVLIAQNIAQQIEKRVSHKRAMKKAIQSALRFGTKGIRITCSGRLMGAEIARSEWYREGRVPLHTIRANVDYSLCEASTAYGVIGIKVWVYNDNAKIGK
ncbi:MAG: 30S ribosomal protein S3 [Rickettsiales bacterium]|jgi:small subunit ribosomal protein S3|nr:30S ribosomal protein S3 [Rickettsiales bacterium]